MSKTNQPKYNLNSKGQFVIDNYQQAKPFSNFFPGVAGLWGIPMWVFYVNRGQCISSFGIESKDKAILEFQAANKAYRLTSIQGFRTFIKIKEGKKTKYWEPFQDHIEGTAFRKSRKMSITAHDLTIEEDNLDLGIKITVNYFTLPEEPFSALVRRVTLENHSSKSYSMEMIDGLPIIIPYGMTEWTLKHMSRTVEAWVKVRNLENQAPYYQLNVEVSDKPEVKHIKEGNFFFSFEKTDPNKKLTSCIIEPSLVFGSSTDYLSPTQFINQTLKPTTKQFSSNRTPSALSYTQMILEKKKRKEFVSLFGFAHSQEELNHVVYLSRQNHFIDSKAKQNQEIIAQIKDYAFTHSSSTSFDLYSGHTFLDNILRGGLPISLKTSEGHVAFNVFSRKHGDPERDYNYFTVAPTYFSQGNGNYRDVNQNRRNDVFFNTDVKDNHVQSFLNLIQADGYNPLTVKGTMFTVENAHELNQILKEAVDEKDQKLIRDFLHQSFMPGALLQFINKHNIALKIDPKSFLGKILSICHKHESADHGEGFWSDHWTYNLDLVESFLGVYPEELKSLLIERKAYHFYHNAHYVLPRDNRYILTKNGVRQYEAVKDGSKEIKVNKQEPMLRIKHGEGAVYKTHLLGKLLCLMANKVSSLDPSGVGVDMEADKPNWYDALNGLPGLLGSSISETFEIKRYAQFLLDALNQINLNDADKISLFEELVTFISGLTNVLSLEKDAYSYWLKSNDIKEHYRQRIRKGIDGEERQLSVAEIKNFLSLCLAKTIKASEAAQNSQGLLSTYFYHEVTNYNILEKAQADHHPLVKPLEFKRHDLPIFLEGYVHALRAEQDKHALKKLYQDVRNSGLYDRKLKMYKVNDDLTTASEDIGRTRIFPRGWLENESIWLHMEYKFMLELLRGGLYEEFYENFQNVLIPFLKPNQYGRNILENSSFIVSSAHEDQSLHGQGYVARLSGSTAEFLHIWLLMNMGLSPFRLGNSRELTLHFNPVLLGTMFTKGKSSVRFYDASYKEWREAELAANTYAFKFLGSVLVVYHNPKRRNTFGSDKTAIKEIHLNYADRKNPIVINATYLKGIYAEDVRSHQIGRIDVFLK
jgi:hypothetical protein